MKDKKYTLYSIERKDNLNNLKYVTWGAALVSALIVLYVIITANVTRAGGIFVLVLFVLYGIYVYLIKAPNAIALDVENEWGKKFTDVLKQFNYAPDWYNGNEPFSSSKFPSSFASSFTSSVSSARIDPTSSSSGGSWSSGSSGVLLSNINLSLLIIENCTLANIKCSFFTKFYIAIILQCYQTSRQCFDIGI